MFEGYINGYDELISMIMGYKNRIIEIEANIGGIEFSYIDELGIQRRIKKTYNSINRTRYDGIKIIKEIKKLMPLGKFQLIEQPDRYCSSGKLIKYKHIELMEQYGSAYNVEIEKKAKLIVSELEKNKNYAYIVKNSRMRFNTEYFEVECKEGYRVVWPTKYLADVVEAIKKNISNRGMVVEFVMMHTLEDGQIIKYAYEKLPYHYRGNVYNDINIEFLLKMKDIYVQNLNEQNGNRTQKDNIRAIDKIMKGLGNRCLEHNGCEFEFQIEHISTQKREELTKEFALLPFGVTANIIDENILNYSGSNLVSLNTDSTTKKYTIKALVNSGYSKKLSSAMGNCKIEGSPEVKNDIQDNHLNKDNFKSKIAKIHASYMESFPTKEELESQISAEINDVVEWYVKTLMDSVEQRVKSGQIDITVSEFGEKKYSVTIRATSIFVDRREYKPGRKVVTLCSEGGGSIKDVSISMNDEGNVEKRFLDTLEKRVNEEGFIVKDWHCSKFDKSTDYAPEIFIYW